AVACSGSGDCGGGAFCNPVTAACTLNVPGVCRTNADCPASATCVPQRVTVAAGILDSDGAGVPDDLGDCPSVPDPLQKDSGRDGVGDACDELNEACSPEPAQGCIAPVDSLAAMLTVKDDARNARDVLQVKLGKLADTHAADFGDPRAKD